MIALAAALLLQASSPADVKTLDVWITDSKGSAVRGLVPEEAAVVEASADLKQKEGERSAVVVVSGVGIGFTNWERRQAVEKARSGNATFMVVQFEETGEPTQATGEQVSRLDYDYVFDNLTRQTGGVREISMSAMGVPRALESVAQALKATYRLSYTTVPDLKERKVEVKVARPGVKVRTGPIRP